MAKRNYDNWSKEELVREVEKLERKLKKNYGLVWEDKLEDVALLCKEKLPILAEDKKKEIDTDKDKPTNILIEGDNYHALSVLNYTHKGRIDIIYIDPPYNTGKGNEWKFNDCYVDEEDAYRHSKWLSFISKRIILSKPLLKESGLIFISIDDNEGSQLKILCDEVFGENNFLAKIVWRKKYGGGKGARFFVDLHEYILCYAKNINKVEGFSIARTDEQKEIFALEDKYIKERGKYYLRPLKSGLAYRKNLIYPIKCPDESQVKTQWICAKETFEELLKEGRIVFKKLKNGKFNVYKKFYENDGGGEVLPESIFYDIAYNQDGKEEIKDIFKVKEGREVPFENAKPSKLIKHLISICPKNNSAVILDYFAGSGSTGHAVLTLNSEDYGNRRFILCTNNENDICTEVCYPRIKRVMEGYKNLKGEEIKGLGDNLKYFKTDFVDAKPTDRNKKKLVDKSTEMLCLKEECFGEVKNESDFKIFKNGQNKYLGIIYDDDGIESFKKEAKKMKKKFVVYVFSLDESAREEEFEDMVHMVQLKPIPAVILNVYKRIFK